MALHKPTDNNGRGFVHIYMGVATICLQTVIYVSGRGFVHTYTLMNGSGYHMSADCNLRKWAWIRAYVHTDEWKWLPYVCRL